MALRSAALRGLLAFRLAPAAAPLGLVGSLRSISGTTAPRSRDAANESLYTQLGGPGAADNAIAAVVDSFYEKLMKKPGMASYFKGIDMAVQKRHQTAFVTVAFGGPSRYAGRSMNAAHVRVRGMGLTDADFDTVKNTLADTLKEFKLTDKQIASAAAIVESTRESIMGRAP